MHITNHKSICFKIVVHFLSAVEAHCELKELKNMTSYTSVHFSVYLFALCVFARLIAQPAVKQASTSKRLIHTHLQHHLYINCLCYYACQVILSGQVNIRLADAMVKFDMIVNDIGEVGVCK